MRRLLTTITLLILLSLSGHVAYSQVAQEQPLDSTTSTNSPNQGVLSDEQRAYAAGVMVANDLLIERLKSLERGESLHSTISMTDFMNGFSYALHNLTAADADSIIAVAQSSQELEHFSSAVGSMVQLMSNSQQIDSTSVKNGISDCHNRRLKMNVEYAENVCHGRDVSQDVGLGYSPTIEVDGTATCVSPKLGGKSIAEAFRDLLTKLVQYPSDALIGASGMAIVEFVIERDGYISKVTIKRSSNSAILDDEALHIVSLLPKAEPKTVDGVPTHCLIQVPIVFPSIPEPTIDTAHKPMRKRPRR